MSRIAQMNNGREDSCQTIRIVIADRNRMASHLLADVLSRIPNFVALAVVEPAQILTAVSDEEPQVVVLSADFDHDPTRGIQLASTLHGHAPGVRPIILVDSPDREVVVGAFRAGARGIFCRTDSLENLGKCIRRVDEGQIWINNSQILLLLETLIATAPYRVVDARGRELLSGRELEVVQLAVKGCINREIADKMNLSEHTVKNYMFRAFDKLGVSNRVEMLFYVLSQSRPGPTLVSTSEPTESRATIAELQEAAQAGSASAQMELGLKYQSGSGVGRSKGDAYFWLRLAEEKAKEICAKSGSALRTLSASIAPADNEAIERRVQEWMDMHRTKISKKTRTNAAKRQALAS